MSPIGEHSLGLGDTQFSDCTIRLYLELGSILLVPPESPSVGPSTTPGTRGSRAPQTRTRGSDGVVRARDVPVCTLVLAAKSDYFRILFTGNFAESLKKDTVDIHIPEDGEGPFLDLVFFLYNGCLPQRLRHSVSSTLRLLAMADRLDTKGCVNECVSCLLGTLKAPCRPEEALHCFSLPRVLQERPAMAPLMTAAKECIVRGYSPLLRTPYGPRLLSLPDHVLALLLESDDLEVDKEDDVLEAAKAWVCHNHPENPVDALCRVVLPRVRHLSLSPKSLMSLAAWEKLTFFGIPDSPPPSPPNSDTSNFLPATSPSSFPDIPSHRPTQRQVAPTAAHSSPSDVFLFPGSPGSPPHCSGDSCPSDPAALFPAAAEAHEASVSALLALSERCFLEFGAVPGGSSIDKCLTGRAWRAPRRACLPPCGRIYLDIPQHCCQEFQPVDEDLAASALTLISGRWLELKAQYHSGPGTIGLWLTWHLPPQAKEDCWHAKCKFLVMTEASQPAYQALHTTVAKFEVEISCWGVEGALSMASIMEEAGFFFPQGALRVRADIWNLS